MIRRRQCPSCGHTVVFLTPRQQEMLAGLARGDSNASIARRAGISEKTVRNTMRSLYADLGVASRLQAALLGVREGLADPEWAGAGICRLEPT